MDLITSAQRAVSVAERWRETYQKSDGTWRYADKQGIYNQLLTAKTVGDIERIIGNTTWTKSWCVECHESKDAAILFGDADDEYSVIICLDCIGKAARISKHESS